MHSFITYWTYYPLIPSRLLQYDVRDSVTMKLNYEMIYAETQWRTRAGWTSSPHPIDSLKFWSNKNNTEWSVMGRKATPCPTSVYVSKRPRDYLILLGLYSAIEKHRITGRAPNCFLPLIVVCTLTAENNNAYSYKRSSSCVSFRVVVQHA